MPKGKKTPLTKVYKIMLSYIVTSSYTQTARDLNMPESTVEKIVKENINEPEFVKLYAEKKEEFASKASKIIDKIFDKMNDVLDNEESQIPLNQLSTAIGTLYDKRALARGESTYNVNVINNNTVEKLAEIAGYEKK